MSTYKMPQIAVPGELDPAFASGGKFEIPTSTKAAVSLLVDHDALTVLTTAGQVFCVCRVDGQGQLDLGFADAGWLKWRFADAQPSIPTRLLLQSDKKILVIGASYSSIPNGQPALTRFNSDGSPDLVFGRKVLTIYPQPQHTMTRVEGCLQSDGKIVLCGAYSSSSGSKALLIRLTSDGELDPEFGIDGIAELAHPRGRVYPIRVAVQSNGRIIVAGSVDDQGIVIGVAADGRVDRDFADQGFALIAAREKRVGVERRRPSLPWRACVRRIACRSG